jgi:SAM-dependent methyltransferase
MHPADLIDPLAGSPTIEVLPEPIELVRQLPPNPPEALQMKFVGSAYRAAYVEAANFVQAADEFAAKHGRGGLATLGPVVDFGSGWGRITRMLLALVPAQRLYALDVDQGMTALVNTTLPGVNAITVGPEPPTVLGDGAVDAIVAFSVFSHLSGRAHATWAAEFGRILSPGGVVALTVLDDSFFDQVAAAHAAAAAGSTDAFAESFTTGFPDVSASRAGYKAGQLQYASTGGGEMRTGDYYGWAVAPRAYVERVWGESGIRLLEWVPSGVLFNQAMVFLKKDEAGSPGEARRSLRSMLRPSDHRR